MMNFVVFPSLEHLTLIKIAAMLWNQHDIKNSVVEFYNSPLFPRIELELYFPPIRLGKRRQKWQIIEDKVIGKVSQLTMRTSLNEKILHYIQAVGFQILKWVEYHRGYCNLDLHLPNEFSWTFQGTVDKRKTAEMIIKNENTHVTTRYKLSCLYCLEEDIRKLWNEMLETDKETFYSKDGPNRVSQQKLVTFWTYTIKGEADKINRMTGRPLNHNCSSYRYAFRCAAISGNKEATEYFFNKLRNKQLILKTAMCAVNRRSTRRECREVTYPPPEYYAEVFCFLLSQMNNEQQMAVFSKCNKILDCFLEWPRQNFFVQVANCLSSSFVNDDYNFILRLILSRIVFGYKDYNYEKIFEDFWQQLSDTLKSYIIRDASIAGLVLMIMQIKGQERINIFKLIFQNATLIDKNELIFSKRGLYICEDLINERAWDLAKFFVQQCITSKDEMIKFKEEFEKDVETRVSSSYWGDTLTEMISKCDEFSQILDDFVLEYGKRKIEDENNSSSTKKLCTTSNEFRTHCSSDNIL